MTDAATASQDDNEPEEPDLSHRWVVNAQVEVDAATAKYADFRGSFRAKEQTRIDALDVMCGECRRHFEDVADEPCAAKINNEHLRGGPIGERRKRKVFEPVGAVVPGPRIDRRGVQYLVGGP